MAHRFVLVFLAPLVGCIKQVPRSEDAPRPADAQAILSLAPLASAASASRSAFTQPRERDLMSRVLLSPNLVFEASRSSSAEPKTVGPKGASDSTPNLEDALGEPVDISLSTRLIEYLSMRGSVVLAPAITRRFSDLWWCSDVSKCPQATWVERLMMLYGLKRWAIDPKEREAERPSGPPQEVRPQDLASVAFAVRALSFGYRTKEAVVERTGDGEYAVRLKRGGQDPGGLCSDLKVQIPLVLFQAELVSLKDGRILARIHEERMPPVSAATRQSFTSTRQVPQTETSYTEMDYEGYGVEKSKYSYIKSWTSQPTLCGEVRERLAVWEVAAHAALKSELSAVTAELFKTALEPLYGEKAP
jgi:hypothetical protein